MICKDIMKQAIADWCKTRRSYLDSQFDTPLTDIEFNNALNPENWLLASESIDPDDLTDLAVYDGDYKIVNGVCKKLDYDDYDAWFFDCEPFGDQLRAYVKVEDEKVIDVLVQGE